MGTVINFNNAPRQILDADGDVVSQPPNLEARKERHDKEKEEIKSRMASNPLHILQYLFPAGRVRSKEFLVGSIAGEPGKSLSINIDTGVWSDFAAGIGGGDFLDLWMSARGCNFPEAIRQIKDFYGMEWTPPKLKTYKDDKPLPPPTATWYYKDETNETILVKVTRYDYPDGTKEFRPYDAVKGKHGAPEIRPLYNLHGVSQSQYVVLVEGEKCAEALISLGICATTAMSGANTAIDKTDWSPLCDRTVLIWPDNDEPGREYAARASNAIQAVSGTAQILKTPEGKPDKWDAADAVAEGFDVLGFLKASQAKEEPGISIISMEDILDMDCPIRWYIEGLLGEKESLVIPGKSGIGKSMLTLDMALHMAMPQITQEASALNFNPRTNTIFEIFNIVRPLTSLFIQAENSVNATQFRLKQMIQGNPAFIAGMHRIKIPYLKNNIRIPGNLALQSFQDMLTGMIEEHEVDVVFLDPLISYHEEDENDNSSMRKLLDHIDTIQDQTGASFIIIHHVGKSTVDNDVFPGRGASSIGDWTANTLIVNQPNQEYRDSDGELRDIMECNHFKCRNAKRQGKFYLERGGDLLLRRIENPAEKKEGKSNAGIAVEILSMVAGKYVESRKELVDLIVGSGKLKRSAAQTAINEATETGLIVAVPTYGAQVGYRLPEVRISGFED